METSWYFVLTILFLLSAGCGFLLLQLRKERSLRENEQANVKSLQDQVNSIELKSVESRLNPHLFKNILNSIQSHAYQTYFALDKLANVLDYILYDSRSKFVTPKEEVDFALNLIEINKIKISPLFEFKVKLKIDAGDPLYDQKVMAPLISVDLIENAFKHADLQNQDSFINITFEFNDGVFGLIVSNKISGKEPLQKSKGGIGSETLEQRLKLIYKDKYQLDKVREGDTYVAYLKIDLREHKA